MHQPEETLLGFLCNRAVSRSRPAWISLYECVWALQRCPRARYRIPKLLRVPPMGQPPRSQVLFVHISEFQSVIHFTNKLNFSISCRLCFLLLHVICMQIKLPGLALQSAHLKGKHGIFIYLQNTLFPFFSFCANKAEFSLHCIWSILAKLTMKDYCVKTNGVLHLFPLTALWFKYSMFY